MKKILFKLILVSVICLNLSGCATMMAAGNGFVACIQTSGQWSGTFDGYERSGEGNVSIPLGSDQPQCFYIRNESASEMSVRIEMNGYPRSKWYTIEEFESDTVCSDTPEGLTEITIE